MALDKNYYSYGVRRDREDDSALISRARDVISRASGHLPATSSSQLPAVPGSVEQQRLLTEASRNWALESALYASAQAAESSIVRRQDTPLYNEVPGDYSDDRKARRKDRRRDRRRERDERRPQSDRPCRTILIKHLPAEVDDSYLRGILQLFGAPVQDVRLVKHKDSGASRGFAFVEFQFLPDAQRWMEENQGTLVIGDSRASLTYSKSRGDEDWFCSQCGTQNFKRRENCFKCGIEKNESERYSQISTTPTRILLLMGLDSMTTEEKIQRELHDITAIDMNIQLIRDPTTNTSRGLCYVALSAVEYSSHLMEILNNMQPPFIIDGKPISVHFCKEGSEEDYSAYTDAEAAAYYQQQAEAASGVSAYDQSYSAYAAAAAAAAQAGKEVSVADKVALAQEQVQAARKMQQEQQKLTQKLLNKMRQGGSSSSSSSTTQEKKAKRVKIDLPPPGTDGDTLDPSQIVHEVKPTDRITEMSSTAEAATAQSLQHQISGGSEGGYYPDLSQYQYDESSGFYYDPQTGLYYDPNSQYYYNAHSQQYMYWDGSQYIPAQQHVPSTKPPVSVPDKDDKSKKEKNKTVAKKVANDMRRWAASMNEMKNNKSKKGANDYKKDNSSASADAGFAVLSKKADPVETKQSVMLALKRSSTSDDQRNKAASITNILAQYGGGSDSEPEEEAPPPSKKAAPSSSKESVPTSLTDWTKLICLLCKRQFPSKEVLVKHQQFSDLHKQNLEALKKRTGLEQQQALGDGSARPEYRDRAKERRSRFN